MGCADRLKNKPETEIFQLWKNQLKKHEAKIQTIAT
jgi:hypothetical protein